MAWLYSSREAAAADVEEAEAEPVAAPEPHPPDEMMDEYGGFDEEEGTPQAPPADSRRDEWARPQRTEINDIPLRILIQDEHSKVNVYGMLYTMHAEVKHWLAKQTQKATEASKRVRVSVWGKGMCV